MIFTSLTKHYQQSKFCCWLIKISALSRLLRGQAVRHKISLRSMMAVRHLSSFRVGNRQPICGKCPVDDPDLWQTISTAPSVTWTPFVAGSYVLRLTVRDENGMSASHEQTIVVSESRCPRTMMRSLPGGVSMLPVRPLLILVRMVSTRSCKRRSANAESAGNLQAHGVVHLQRVTLSLCQAITL